MAAAKKKSGAKSKKGRNDQVIRILRMLSDLSLAPADIYELSQRYGTTDRTIRRDLDAIEQWGVILTGEIAEDSNRKRWSIDRRNAGLPDIDSTHFIALTLALREGQVLRSSQLASHFDDFSQRVERALGASARHYLQRIDDAFFSWDKFAWRQANPNHLVLLLDAIVECRKCTVEYRAPTADNKVKKYDVLPLKLLVHQGSLYLHAWTEKFKKVLLLNVSRLQKLTPTDVVMERPAGYDPHQLAQSAFGIFIGPEAVAHELHFDPRMRPYIEERQWHPTQTLSELPGGWLKVEFSCVPSYEVSNWVASWREHVKVVKPQALRDELAGYAVWLAKEYPAPKDRKAS